LRLLCVGHFDVFDIVGFHFLATSNVSSLCGDSAFFTT
jgi:hypothetical protein